MSKAFEIAMGACVVAVIVLAIAALSGAVFEIWKIALQ